MEDRRDKRHRDRRDDSRHREEKSSSHRSSSKSRDDSNSSRHYRRDDKRKRESSHDNPDSKRRRDSDEPKRPIFEPKPTVPNGHYPGQTPSEDALAKARKLLELKKSIAEKMKKVTPQINEIKQAVPPATPVAALPVPVKDAGKNIPPAPSVEAMSRVHDCVTRMGFHQPPGAIPLIPPSGVPPQKSVKPPPLLVDALGREIDEHGVVVDQRKAANVSTLKVNINKQKKDAFQILHPELEEDPVNDPFFDRALKMDKQKRLRPKKPTIQFVEEGRWIKRAEIIRLNNQYGEAKAREIRAKQAILNKAKAEGDINPNLIEVSERVSKDDRLRDSVPDVEWWDAILLPTGKYSDVSEVGFKKDKINIYAEHPVPIEPPAEPAPPPPQPLKLTKKEQRKMRTQRRVAREKERQEMVRQGKIEPPKSKVKMSNLHKVLSSEATQDPTKMEQEIRSAAAERERAHIDRNLARKLTPAERREKKDKKLFDDASTPETIVSVYRVGKIPCNKTRFKVDVNAQENRLTGCALVTDNMTVVVVEGGSKAIKRYDKLMTRRIDWNAKDENAASASTGDDEDKDNKCIRVWQGSVARPAFHQFSFQKLHTPAAARKYLADVEVAHYWDSALEAVTS